MNALTNISIIIPAYNEESCIKESITAVVSSLEVSDLSYEIVVCDDLSTDSTKQIICEMALKNSTIQYYLNSFNKGYGGAVKTGISKATGEYCIIVTADLSDNPSDIIQFYNKIISGNYDFIHGYRFSRNLLSAGYPLFKYAICLSGNYLISKLLRLPFLDFTNSFKMYRLSFLRTLDFSSDGFEVLIELIVSAHRKSSNYCVIHNDWVQRTSGVNKMNVVKTSIRYLRRLFQLSISQS